LKNVFNLFFWEKMNGSGSFEWRAQVLSFRGFVGAGFGRNKKSRRDGTFVEKNTPQF